MNNNPESPRPLRIGVVGCGNVMDGAYMPYIQRLKLSDGPLTVTWACDTRPEKAKPILAKWQIENFTTDYRGLCSAEDVDIVLILTAMESHGAITRQALENGKHVLVEKPLSTDLDEAGELLKFASTSQGILMCAPFVILSPTFRILRSRVQSGDIGKVLSARARYGWSGPDWNSWFYQSAGGCLFDLGVYNLTSLTGLLGPAQRVTALAGVAIPERIINGITVRVSVEDNAQVLLDFGDSVFGCVTAGFTIQKYRTPAIELYGSEGTLQLLGDDWAPQGYELWQNSVGAWQVFYETDPHWQWMDGLCHLLHCIRTGSRPLVTPEHAYHVLEIMLAARRAASQGKVQVIHSRFSLPEFAANTPAEAAHRIHDWTRE